MNDPGPQPTLHLADHVRACVIGNQAVILDLKHSRYLGLDRRQWQAALAAAGTGRRDAPVVDMLRSRKILTAKATAPSMQQRQPLLPTAAASADTSHAAAGASVGLRDVCHFLTAAALAAASLRFRSLEAVARSLDMRHRAHNEDVPDRKERLARAVAVFERLRPLVFSSKDQCLFDSLALTIFLARQGIAVHWVIGVSTQPFKAHAWVQDGAEVLNDLHETVGRFTPLLVV